MFAFVERAVNDYVAFMEPARHRIGELDSDAAAAIGGDVVGCDVVQRENMDG